MPKYIFYKLVWQIDPVQSILHYIEKGTSNIIKKPIKIGDNINIKFGSTHYCIGTELDKGIRVSCIKNHQLAEIRKVMNLFKSKYMTEYNYKTLDELESDQKFAKLFQDEKLKRKKEIEEKITSENKINPPHLQCYYCSQKDFFRCRIICMGNECNPSSPRAKKLCEPSNTGVYLTSIAGKLKVGVSLNTKRRWLEQGSDFATKIVELPGLEARRLEQEIGQNFDLKLQIRNTDKINEIKGNDDGGKEIEELVHRTEKNVDYILNIVDGEKFENPLIEDLRKHYGQLEFDTPLQEIDPKINKEFGGKIVSIKGSLIVVKNGIYYYALDTKKIISLVFEFMEREAKIKSQTSLSEWFN